MQKIIELCKKHNLEFKMSIDGRVDKLGINFIFIRPESIDRNRTTYHNILFIDEYESLTDLDKCKFFDMLCEEVETTFSLCEEHIESVDTIIERADVKWYDDVITHERIVVSYNTYAPVTDSEQEVLISMWRSSGFSYPITFYIAPKTLTC